MKYIDEYRDKAKVLQLLQLIKEEDAKSIRIMEVCGGHTMSIHKFGIPSLLPSHIQLVSGPGCPVCVTDRKYIDQAIAYARMPNTIITTYGDLIRVPGSSSSLEKERSNGRDIRIVYSVLDAHKIAIENPSRNIIFLGIGFETTTPSSAFGILNAAEMGLHNFFVFSAHKLMPPAMKALIDEQVNIDAYLGPGHVSAIAGTQMYDFIPSQYHLGVVVSGFEPTDILTSILMLVKQLNSGQAKVEIQYKRAVKREGNIIAKAAIEKVFETRDDWWRGLGILKNSGLKIKESFEQFDAEKAFEVEVEPTRQDSACICGAILKGIASPSDCKLFARACNPENPIGACMVSNEGACHAFYRYGQ